MKYHADDTQISFSDLRQRLEETDLVPSRAELKNGLAKNLDALKGQGMTSLQDLRRCLKIRSYIPVLAKATGIKASYLNLLRREIESQFPKPVKIEAFKWLTRGETSGLKQAAILTSQNLYERIRTKRDLAALLKATHLTRPVLMFLTQVCDLLRIQWVSPGFARMLIAAGYVSTRKVAATNADDLDTALQKVNAKGEFFRGRIGLRDVRRVIKAASYV